MPAHEIPFPIGATSVKLIRNNREYPIELAVDGFTRTSEQGSIPVLALCGGDEFYGYSLEGWWKKSWDSYLDGGGGAQAFSAILNGSGSLYFKGECDTPGENGDGWINGHLPIPLMDETEITFAMSVPVDDTGSTASRDIEFHFYLMANQKNQLNPQPNTSSALLWQINVDESGLINYLYGKSAGGGYSSLFSGSTYDDASARDTGDLEACIIRIVFHDGHADMDSPSDGRHIHVYMKQADTIANAEDETENQLSSSPFDVDWLGMDVAYPAFQIRTQNGSYYDDDSEAIAGYLRINYPDFDTKYDISPSNRVLEDVCLYDGDPDGSGVKVYDVDHVFSGDAYIRNGLVELWVDELAQYGLKFSYWDAADYSQPLQQVPYLYNAHEASTCLYPELLKVIKWGPEEVVVDVRMHEDASADSDIFIDLRIWIKRGSYNIEYLLTNIMKRGNWNTAIYDGTANAFRFSFAHEDYLADDDLDPATQDNTNMLENYMCQVDPDQESIIPVIAATHQPTSLSVDDGSSNMYLCNIQDLGDARYVIAYIPFANVDELFSEAEDATSTGTNTVDANASNGECERLDAQGNYLTPAGEYVYYRVIAGTDLPEGRYVVLWRALDSNQVADDFRIYVYNASDSAYRNEENEKVTETLTADYAFYSLVFDVKEGDVSGTDNFDIVCEKATADANDIDVDDILIIPIGDGESFPQDIAHNFLREIFNEWRLYDR